MTRTNKENHVDRKRISVCNDTPVLRPGEYFDWVNPHAKQCILSGCQPPLESDTYVVPGQDSAPARVDPGAKPKSGDYPNSGDCCVRAQPRIKIETKLRKKARAKQAKNTKKKKKK